MTDLNTDTQSERDALWAINVVKDNTGLTDAQIGEASGFGRRTIQEVRAGQRRLTVAHLEGFARAFEVPIQVFLMSRFEVKAWLLDHLEEIRPEFRLESKAKAKTRRRDDEDPEFLLRGEAIIRIPQVHGSGTDQGRAAAA